MNKRIQGHNPVDLALLCLTLGLAVGVVMYVVLYRALGG